MAGEGLVGRWREARRSDTTVVERSRLDLLEASDTERRALQKELDLLGWHVLDYVSGHSQEVRFEERRKLAQQARVAWLQDPLLGAAVDLTNDFTFGRGVPKPKAADEQVQDVLDEFWDDPDNQLVLTSYVAQVALGTDLSLQSNLFVLLFDDGDDGKVKLGLLDHDTVQNAVRDEDMRQRVLYYVAREVKVKWDYQNDKPLSQVYGEVDPTTTPTGGKAQKPADKAAVRYYEHHRNVRSAEGEGRSVATPPSGKMGEGRVYHIAINRTSEMVFGSPGFRRIMRFASALNDLMKARVDMAQAAAAFIMKRKVKGTPNQVAKLAAKAVSRRSELSARLDDDTTLLGGPRPGSIINENEQVSHENVALNTGAAQAAQDMQMIRSQVSAYIRFPQHYLGDQGQASLATATATELPVLKAIEARQELFEGLFRTCLDRAIERAVESGRIPKNLTAEERAALKAKKPGEGAEEEPGQSGQPPEELTAAYEGQGTDEDDTERDLSYEFSMPNPLKRAVVELVGAIANIARTFDPNNTNPELSRVLLSIALGEGLEVADPAGLVERIFPKGYKDPALAAQEQMQQQQAPQPNFFGPEAGGSVGADGQVHPPDNPYGAPQKATPPEQMQQAAGLPPILGRRLRKRGEEIEALFQEEVVDLASEALAGRNGGSE